MSAIRNASCRMKRELPGSWSRHLSMKRPMTTTAATQLQTEAATTVNHESRPLQQTQAQVEITQPTKAELNELFDSMPPLSYPKHFKVECLSNPETINKRIAELVWYDKRTAKFMHRDIDCVVVRATLFMDSIWNGNHNSGGVAKRTRQHSSKSAAKIPFYSYKYYVYNVRLLYCYYHLATCVLMPCI